MEWYTSPPCGKVLSCRAGALDHVACWAKLCRRTFVDGSIQWASAECTVEADGRDRTEAACLDSHGWAQRGRGESCDALDSRVQKGWRGCSSETDDTGTSLWCSVLHRFFFDCFFFARRIAWRALITVDPHADIAILKTSIFSSQKVQVSE